ncbi:MAG: aminoglycoside phosphotransferase family protein [Myxococcales bacterium]|nr:aminoglycoside phosphotransferase family protein [Myxococcales bacterium]
MTAAGRDTPVDPGADANLLQRLAGEIGCDSHQLRWRFIGSARGPCRVWQVSGAGEAGALIVKQFRGERAFQQEHHAYRSWLPQLPEETATLLAAFAAPVRALVLAQVAGEPLTVAPVGPELERAAHKRAGYFLRALHAVPEADLDPVPLSEAVRLRHAAWLERVRPAVSAEVLAQLRERGAAAHTGLFAAARRVPCHRDFTPGNWLVSGPLLEGQMLALDGFYVVDFEHAHLDCPLFDIVKLWTDVWGERPDLEAAFFAGYGRGLTALEQEQLRVLAAMHAMATLAWAHEHADLHFQALGEHALRRVLA